MTDQPTTQRDAGTEQGGDQAVTAAVAGVADLPSTRAELREWLAALPAIPRARLLALLTDGQVRPELVALRWAAVAEAAGNAPVVQVAADLGGISQSAVYRAIRRHKAATAKRTA